MTNTADVISSNPIAAIISQSVSGMSDNNLLVSFYVKNERGDILLCRAQHGLYYIKYEVYKNFNIIGSLKIN
jgi:hypothetical protein